VRLAIPGDGEGENFPENRNVYRKMKVEIFKLQLNTHMHTFSKYDTKHVATSVKTVIYIYIYIYIYMHVLYLKLVNLY